MIASYPSLTLIDFHNYCKEGLLSQKNIIICKINSHSTYTFVNKVFTQLMKNFTT